MVHLTDNNAVRMPFDIFWVFVVFPVFVWLVGKWARRSSTTNDNTTNDKTQERPTSGQERPASVPAGWYPDPSGAPGMRYWDGSQWNLTAQLPRQ
jgi:hypothetical protein